MSRTTFHFIIIVMVSAVSASLVSAQLNPEGHGSRHGAPSPAKERYKPVDPYGDPLPAHAIARFGTSRFWLDGGCCALAFVDDDKLLVGVPGNDKQALSVWDTVHAQIQARLPVAGASVMTLAPGRGADVVCSCTDGVVRVFNARTGALTASVDFHQESAPDIAVSRRQGIAAIAQNDGQIVLFDIRAGKKLRTLATGSNHYLSELAIAETGKLLVANERGAAIRAWELPSGRLLWADQPPSDVGNFIALSRDGTRVAYGDLDGRSLHTRKTSPHARWQTLRGCPSQTYSACFDPTGQYLFATQTGVAKVDANSAKVYWWKRRSDRLISCALSNNGRLLAVGSLHGQIAILDPATGTPIISYDRPMTPAAAVAFDPSGETVAVANADKMHPIRLWRVRTSKNIVPMAIHDQSVSCVNFSPDGSLIAYGTGHSCGVGLYAPDRRQVKHVPGHNNAGGKTWVMFLQDGRRLVSAGADGVVNITDIYRAHVEKRIRMCCGSCLCFACTPDAAHMIAVQAPEKLYIWHADSGRPQMIFRKDAGPALLSVAISPDGGTLAKGMYDGSIVLLDAKSGRITGKLLAGQSPVRAVTFSSDGAFVVGGSDVIRIWEVATRSQVMCMHDPSNGVRCLGMSRNDRRIVAGNADTTTLVWDATGLADGHHEALAVGDIATLNHLWRTLASANGVQAYKAMWAMVNGGKYSGAFLAQRLRPIAPLDRAAVDQYITNLDDARFTVREAATTALLRLGRVFPEPIVDLEGKRLPLEAKRRLQTIQRIISHRERDPEWRRTTRMIWVLAHLEDAGAHRILRNLATGAREAELTAIAKHALALHENGMRYDADALRHSPR